MEGIIIKKIFNKECLNYPDIDNKKVISVIKSHINISAFDNFVVVFFAERNSCFFAKLNPNFHNPDEIYEKMISGKGKLPFQGHKNEIKNACIVFAEVIKIHKFCGDRGIYVCKEN